MMKISHPNMVVPLDFLRGPGKVARCATCEHVLLRVIICGQWISLDMRGMACLCLDASPLREAS